MELTIPANEKNYIKQKISYMKIHSFIQKKLIANGNMEKLLTVKVQKWQKYENLWKSEKTKSIAT